MTTPANPLPLDDDLPDELPGIAQRLQAAINEVFVANEPSASKPPSEDGQLDRSADSLVAAAGTKIDRRLYFPDAEGWECRVKSGPREYCSRRNLGEEWFHLLLDGELFLQFDEEKVCLNCAYRSGLLTDDRLFWQKGQRRQRIFPVSDTAPGIEAAAETPEDLPDQPLTTEYVLENPNERET